MISDNLLVVSSSNPFFVKDGITAANNSLVRSLKDIAHHVFIDESRTLIPSKDNDTNLIDDFNINLYDSVIFGSLNLFRKHQKNLKSSQVVVVQLSDCYTYALYKNVVISLRCGWLDWKSLLKIPLIYFREVSLAKRSKYLLMQTPVDVRILKKLRISTNGIAFPNIPNNKNYKSEFVSIIPLSIGWCASFKGAYLKVAKWFFKKVLKEYLERNLEISLHLSGGDALIFRDWIVLAFPEFQDRIISYDYIDNISTFYSRMTVNICPIFKGYGLINKCVEGMLSGGIILGDKAAFNGLSIKNTQQAFIANELSEWSNHLDFILFNFDDNKRSEMSKLAIQMVNEHLNLDDNFRKLQNILP